MKISGTSVTAGLLFASCLLAGCGAGAESKGATAGDDFDPPPPPAGYQRIVAPVVADVTPGTDVMYCQYLFPPLDHDIDILDVKGYQSKTGHHAIAYSMPAKQPIGSSVPCSSADNDLPGSFIGGIGGESGGKIVLPEGVAFRLPKGNTIMINSHFLNATHETVDGKTVLDVRFAPADPSRKIASLFTNANLTFRVPANSPAQAVAECTFPHDMELFMLSNHMHEHGSHISTELERAGQAQPELIHEDPTWTYDMQFDAVPRTWPVNDPLRIRTGDVLRTRCFWNNTSGEAYQFPREMCLSLSLFISDGSSSPVCVDGTWVEAQASGP